jgi:acyl-CoA synthetase (AMP-forming)/AMP-acid ligase II
MELNYFTCTLGEAAKYSLTNPKFKNISSFLDYQAKHIPDLPAVGFYQLSSTRAGKSWSTKVLSFREVRDASDAVADKLSSMPGVVGAQTAALLCLSSVDFILIWLALIRLDITVLLLAPQCQSDAIVHLCRVCEAEVLLYDSIYQKPAQDAVSLASKCRSEQPITFSLIDVAKRIDHDVWELIHDLSQCDVSQHRKTSKARLQDIAYIHHTSGTSLGLPKPIHQPHKAAVGALPNLPNGKNMATSLPRHCTMAVSQIYSNLGQAEL